MLHGAAIPYMLHMLVLAVTAVAVAIYIWRRRSAPGAMAAVLLALAVAVRSLGYAFELGLVGLAAKLFWVRFAHLGMAIAPIAWLVLALKYTGRGRWLRGRYLALLAIEPLVTLLLAWTNEYHHLVYSEVRLDTSGLLPTLDLTFGEWAWFDSGYSSLLFVIGSFLLIHAFIHMPPLYRKQVGVLLIGLLVSAAAELMAILDLMPQRLDMTPFAYTFTIVAAAWGLFHYRFLDVVPVAHDAVIENMEDGVIVLDRRDRVVDLNSAARRIVGGRGVVGRPADQALPAWPSLNERGSDTLEVREEIVLGEDEERRYFELHVSPLYDWHSSFAGRLVILRDISERRRAEDRVQRLLDQQVIVNRLALVLGKHRDLEEVYRAIYEHVRMLLDAEVFVVSSFDEETRLIQVEYLVRAGNLQQDVADSSPTPLEEVERSAQGRVILGGEPLRIPDWRETEIECSLDELDLARSALLAPMKIAGKTTGIIQVRSRQADAYSQEDVDFLSGIANVAAVAVQTIHLYVEQQRRVEESGVLLEIANAINSTLELDRILKEVALRAARACGADRCTILMLDEKGQNLSPTMSQFASGDADEEMWLLFKKERRPQKLEDIPEAVRAIRERLPLFIADASASSLPRRWVELFDLEDVLVVPLITRERAVGLMGLDHFKGDHKLTREKVDLAMTIGSQVAVAIDNARLHREVREQAHQLSMRVRERTAQLRAQYARLEATLNSSSDGIIVVDRKGEVLQANDVAQNLLTRTLSPEDANELWRSVRGLAQRADSRPEQVLELTGLDLQLSAAPITKLEEEAAVVVAIHDVSHLKALDRMKSRFVSNVSHQLRTPITTIKLYAELMRRQPERWEEYLGILTREANRQAQLVEGILQISRIDFGRLEISPHPIALNELVELVLANHEALAQKQGVALEFQPAESGPVALVDSERAGQMLGNLVANAIQYTSEGGRVVVSTGKERAEGRVWAVARVADTGMGIPKEELPHVFERFFRGEQPRLMQLSGTGLGLAIAKEIVDLHGGRIEVESEVDVGTTFTVWLPLAD